MSGVFIVCACVGGTVLVVQFVLALIGLGGDALSVDVPHDIGHDFGGDFHGDAAGIHGAEHSGHDAAHHGSTWLFGVLSFRTIVAALAFFGLAGLAAQAADTTTSTALLVAVTAGAAAMFAVYGMMRGLQELRAEGTARIHRAQGQHGTVYLRIPGNQSGSGKIQLNLQNRTMEYLAVTSGPELPTGTRVVVVGVVNPTTLEVQAD